MFTAKRMDDGRVTSSVLYYVTIFACFISIVTGRIEDGSCNFDKDMCGYTRMGSGETLKWKINERSYLSASSEGAEAGEISQIQTPLISLNDGHCVTFKYRIRTTSEDESGADDVMTTATAPSGGGSDGGGGEIAFNLYVLDAHDDASFEQLVWMTSSSGNHSDEWQTIQISLSPSSYQIMFEAVLTSADRTTAVSTAVDVDTVERTNQICDGKTVRFLRMSKQTVNNKQDSTLTCSLYGSGSFLPSHVSLQKAGSNQAITPNSLQRHFDHVFFTFDFNEADMTMDGMYRCVYQNDDVIAISNPARLGVKIPPVPIRAPEAVDIGPTHVQLQLHADSFNGDGPVIRKTLIYQPENKAWNQTHAVDGDTYILWHLTPDTSYYFSLLMSRTGRGGRGTIGPEVKVTTTCSAPTMRVSNVEVRTPTYHQITIQWEKLDFADINCHSYNYNVNYRINDDSNSGFESISSGKKNIAVVNHLLPYTQYELRVAIVNGAGNLETTSYYMRTEESVPGPIPRDSFHVISTSSSSIDLKWEKPQHENGQLRNYQISYQAISSFDPTFNVHNENAHIERSFPDRSIALQMLRPGTKFNISICAETSAGCGPNVSLLVITEIAPPTMARNPPVVNETHVTDTTVEVVLIPAHSNGAPVTKYYLVVEDITDEVLEDDERGISKRSVVGLHPRVRRSVTTTEKVQVVTTPPSGESSSKEEENGACKMDKPLDYDSAKKQNSTKYFAAEFEPEDLDKDKIFVVGDGKKINGFRNHALDPERKYRIYLRADSEINGETKSGCLLLYEKKIVPVPITSDKEKIANGGGENGENLVVYGAISGAVVALMILLVIFIFVFRTQRKRKTPQKDEVVNPFEVRLMLTDMTNTVSPNNSHLLPTLPHHQSSYMSDAVTYHDPGTMEFSTFHFTEKSGGGEGCGTSSTADGDEKFAIRVDDFHLHVSQMKSVDGYGFREEFALFPDGPTAPWNIAQTSINKKKNRYGNIMAYDHSRVVLQPSTTGTQDSSFTSDYINASYISGYKRPAMYIAAQAPSPETCSDFWSMIWQEQCSVIVMLTNLMEMGKRKCHKYWSDERVPYGSLEVSMTNEEFTSDYVVRTFLLREIGGYDVREVRQFHFAAWPDHGVPSRPTNLLTFVRRVKAYEPPEGPTLVHCSAGSGRTGCYITIDQMLDMAREEEIVDVFNTVRELRTRRVDMVQTEEQYIFIHESVLEALICGETSVQPDQLGNHYDEIITVDVVSNLAPIQDEFETLNLITPRLADEECSIARLPRNRAYNRFKDVLPADRHLAYLVTPDSSDRNNSYINAVFVDSYSRKNAFLVTQMPLPSTIVDLWRLIFDHQCTSIVMMNHESEHDQTCAIYWPTKGSVTYGPFTIELVGQEDEIDVVTRMFKLENTNASEGPRFLKQFQLTNWPGPQPVPYSRNAVLRVIQLNMKWKNECERKGSPGRTVVHCVAGAGRSGTFVACHNMCEQMSTEYSADVFNNVQRLRNIRPHLVETLEQYRFCYEVGIEFADQ